MNAAAPRAAWAREPAAAVARLELELREAHEVLRRERAARLAAETERSTALAALRLAMRALGNANGLLVAVALTRRCVVCTEHPRTLEGRSSTGAGK